MTIDSIHKLVINLPSRKDRLERLNLPWEYQIVKGVELLSPMLGIAQAHLNCITLAKEKKHESVLIMEDDVELRKGAEDHLNEALKHLPEDWEILLGGLYESKGLKSFNDYWNRTGEFCGLHFYIVNSKIYDRILNEYNHRQHIDRWMNLQDKRFRCYVLKKFIATQSTGFSDNVKKNVDYTDKIKRFQLL